MERNQLTNVTRRGFLRMAACAAGAVGALPLAGCAAQGGSGTQTSQSVTYALNESPQALDPALVNDFGSLELCANLYEGLFRFKGETCDVEPCLAESYQVSDDGLTYTFRLREGVRFHDGTDFDAAAVVTNFERQMDGHATSGMGYADFVFGSDETGVGVKSVVATDARTVTCTMRSACTPFLRNLAMALGTPIVSPAALAKAGGDLSAAPCGTGPYMLDSWEKDATVTLRAFDGYWDKDNVPKTPTVVFRIMPESAARVTALSNNEVDMITAVETNSAPTVRANGDDVDAIDGLNVNYLCFNTASSKLSSVGARTAVCQAIDVAQMVKTLYGDYADAANSLMPSFMASYVQDVSYPSYDPDAARAAFAAAGITDLVAITYTTAMQYNPAGGQALAESLQGYLAKCGVSLTINSYDWATFRTKRKEEYFDLGFYGWAGDNGDPDNFMNLFASTSGVASMSHFADDTYDRLVEEGIRTPDGSARDDIYHQLEKRLAQLLPCLPLSHAKTVCAYKPSVTGFTMHPTGWSKLAGVAKRA
ncbi:MAG: ABC transporter substrate-binding protein [Atopobiaceae bacterium]|jgi:peptide/nickel transport system substrate-binding protein